jgi:hypothetical protein
MIVSFDSTMAVQSRHASRGNSVPAHEDSDGKTELTTYELERDKRK